MAEAESGQAQATNAEVSFGESEYGARLDYSQSQYRDWLAGVLFYGQLIAMIVGAIIGISKIAAEADEADDDVDSDVWDEVIRLVLTAIVVTMLCAGAVGALFAMLWLKVIQWYAESIIKILLYLMIAGWILLGIMQLPEDNTGGLVVCLIFAALQCLYMYCVWGRIPFAGTCLAVSSVISQTYTGIIGYALLCTLFSVLYFLVTYIATIDYIVSSSNEGTTNGLLVFLMIISIYWGAQVFKNVSHTTTCGVTATWYFNPGVLFNPSRGAFKRTMTTSFGSVAFGSLIVAILQATRSMIKSNRGACLCIAACILCCIERLIRFFNKYAFAQVAIYGTTFWQSAKATWDLFVSRGILAVVNDNLSGIVLVCGSLLGAIVSGAVCSQVFLAFFNQHLLDYKEDCEDTYEGYYTAEDSCDISGAQLVLQIIGWYIGLYTGYYMCAVMLSVVQSGVVGLFVCLSEDPAAGYANRQEEVSKLLLTNLELGNMARANGVALPMAEPVQMPQGADGAATTTQQA